MRHADRLRRRGGEHRHQLARSNADLQAATQLVRAQLSVLQERVEQVLVVLRHRLHELSALALHVRGHVGGDLGLAALLPHVGLHLHQVDNALEAVLAADGQVQRHAAPAEIRLHLLQSGGKVRVLTVHAVDQNRTRLALGHVPRLIRAHL